MVIPGTGPVSDLISNLTPQLGPRDGSSCVHAFINMPALAFEGLQSIRIQTG